MQVNMYTDGACSGNPGPGGWAVLIEAHPSSLIGQKNHWRSAHYPNTTNNEMELRAALNAITLSIKGLWAWPDPMKKEFNIYCDSLYVVKGFNKEWKVQTHLDLWNDINYFREKWGHKIQWNFIWVKGHADNKLNVVVDGLAKLAAKNTPLPNSI